MLLSGDRLHLHYRYHGRSSYNNWHSATCAAKSSGPHASEPVSAPNSWTPDDATFACLKHLRRPDVHSFQKLLYPSQGLVSLPQGESSIAVGDMRVVETGPLAGFSPNILDTAARRVLPGHLLRRCRILSSVQLGGTCLQRVSLTADSGEECVFEWRLQKVSSGSSEGTMAAVGLGEESCSPPSGETKDAAVGVGSEWRIASISRDDSADKEEELPARPHPRASPEVIVLAQLSALRRGDVLGAAKFNMLKGSSFEQQLSAYRAFLRQTAHFALLTHLGARIVASAGPSQKTFVAEVLLQPQAQSQDQQRWQRIPIVNDTNTIEERGDRFIFELGRLSSGWRVEQVRALQNPS